MVELSNLQWEHCCVLNGRTTLKDLVRSCILYCFIIIITVILQTHVGVYHARLRQPTACHTECYKAQCGVSKGPGFNDGPSPNAWRKACIRELTSANYHKCNNANMCACVCVIYRPMCMLGVWQQSMPTQKLSDTCCSTASMWECHPCLIAAAAAAATTLVSAIIWLYR